MKIKKSQKEDIDLKFSLYEVFTTKNDVKNLM